MSSKCQLFSFSPTVFLFIFLQTANRTLSFMWSSSTRYIDHPSPHFEDHTRDEKQAQPDISFLFSIPEFPLFSEFNPPSIPSTDENTRGYLPTFHATFRPVGDGGGRQSILSCRGTGASVQSQQQTYSRKETRKKRRGSTSFLGAN